MCHCHCAVRVSRHGAATTYTFRESANGTLAVTSTYPHDPWIHASGAVFTHVPARCPGGLVDADLRLYYNWTKVTPPQVVTHGGRFGATCSTITMDNGAVYTRARAKPLGSGASTTDTPPAAGVAAAAGCAVAELTFRPSPVAWQPSLRAGWRTLTVGYNLRAMDRAEDAAHDAGVNDANHADAAGAATAHQHGKKPTADTAAHLRVRVDVDARNTTVRVTTDITALVDLPFCLGGVAVLNLTVPNPRPHPQLHPLQDRTPSGTLAGDAHLTSYPTAVLHGSSGGSADDGSDVALQPWVCPLHPTSANINSAGSGSSRTRGGSSNDTPGPAVACNVVAGTPFRSHEDPALRVASVDSGLDGRSSNFQLPIHSVELGHGNASAAAGVWMAPEYSGIWRMDAYTIRSAQPATLQVGTGQQNPPMLGTRFYYSLPSLLFTLAQSESVQLPTASFGVWDAAGGASDWANAVRSAIATYVCLFAGLFV